MASAPGHNATAIARFTITTGAAPLTSPALKSRPRLIVIPAVPKNPDDTVMEDGYSSPALGTGDPSRRNKGLLTKPESGAVPDNATDSTKGCAASIGRSCSSTSVLFA